MNFMKMLSGSALALGIVSFAAIGTAQADVVGYLTSCGLSGGCDGTTAPYGTIDATVIGGNTQITISLGQGFQFYAAGQVPQAFIAFNTSTPQPSFASIDTVPLSGDLYTGHNGDSPQGNPPFGTLNNYITEDVLHNVLLGTTFQFTLAGILNSDWFFSALLSGDHPFLGADTCLTVDGVCTGNTGWLDATFSPSPVPLPPAALLFGTALAGLGFLGRKRKLQSA